MFVIEYEIQLSFTEIHNDISRDLTSSHCSGKKNVIKDGVRRVTVRDEAEALDLYERVKIERKTSATYKNARSSRSHLICRVHLTQYDHRSTKIVESEFSLVDLAG